MYVALEWQLLVVDFPFLRCSRQILAVRNSVKSNPFGMKRSGHFVPVTTEVIVPSGMSERYLVLRYSLCNLEPEICMWSDPQRAARECSSY
eukprot:1377082-Amorphochlora_amoeboformis.AAC.3